MIFLYVFDSHNCMSNFDPFNSFAEYNKYTRICKLICKYVKKIVILANFMHKYFKLFCIYLNLKSQSEKINDIISKIHTGFLIFEF
jgi:hypothetical protein